MKERGPSVRELERNAQRIMENSHLAKDNTRIGQARFEQMQRDMKTVMDRRRQEDR